MKYECSKCKVKKQDLYCYTVYSGMSNLKDFCRTCFEYKFKVSVEEEFYNAVEVNNG